MDQLFANALLLKEEKVPLSKAHKRVLAENVAAPVDHPLFNQTAVDGYALRFEDLEGGQPLLVAGEIKAGDSPEVPIGPGEAVRIFTGAPVPSDADTVVMQEYVEKEGAYIRIQEHPVKKGAHIRKRGEQIRQKEIALPKGTLLNTTAIGFLASLGIPEVTVSRQPSVSIIVTGNEFAEAQEDLRTGKIFESNGIMLQAAFLQMGLAVSYRQCADDFEKMKALVAHESARHDLLIATGGVSVGDYDFTTAALQENGFGTIFHKVRQKPGKPVLFCKKENRAAIGLPGNPRSVMVCFYEYVYPYLLKSMGCATPALPKAHLPLAADFYKKGDRAHFVAARIGHKGLEVLEGQGSHMLQSLAQAGALIAFSDEENHYAKGTIVEAHLLPR